jgi:hypothetical protein
MFRQAVQTLTGRGEADVEPTQADTIFELGSRRPATQTEPEQDGPQDGQSGDAELRATVAGLVQSFENLNTRLSDKDRHIGRLEGELTQFRQGVPAPSAGGVPDEAPDPVLDQETAELYAQKYGENPVEALIAVADHIDKRARSHADTQMSQRDQQAAIVARLSAIEQNVDRQVRLIQQHYGDAAVPLIGDFVNLLDAGNATTEQFGRTWLGSQLFHDKALAETQGGVYRLIEAELLRQGSAVPVTPPAPAPRPAPTGITRPTAPVRDVEIPSDGTESAPPIEDQIADAIVEAARGDDASMQRFFTG